ncbi:MAG: signal peptidase II [Candidatus Omnitrophota bacterium]|jgi:signal peptidase II
MVFIIVSAILVLDRVSKILVTEYLSLNNSVPLIKGVFHFSLVHNQGAAFGLLRNQLPLFILTSLVAVALIWRSLRSDKHNKIYTIALSLILTGALGNLIDRVFYGYVIDFLDFRIWPVFNVADSAITVGAVILGWSILFNKNAS